MAEGGGGWVETQDTVGGAPMCGREPEHGGGNQTWWLTPTRHGTQCKSVEKFLYN